MTRPNIDKTRIIPDQQINDRRVRAEHYQEGRGSYGYEGERLRVQPQDWDRLSGYGKD